jgi:hypothetical protein
VTSKSPGPSPLPITETTAPSAAVRGVISLLALLGWAFLALQLWLALTTGQANGQPAQEILTNYFSYFTILTNLLVTLVFTWVAIAPPGPPAALQAPTAVYIVVVAIGYSLLLRSAWDPEGLQKVADVMLHDIMPLLYVIFWMAFSRRLRAFRWKHAFLWLIWPLIYLLYSMVRGQLTRWYPYPFLDPGDYGYPRVIGTIFAFMLGFLGVSLTVVALTRFGHAENSGRATYL